MEPKCYVCESTVNLANAGDMEPANGEIAYLCDPCDVEHARRLSASDGFSVRQGWWKTMDDMRTENFGNRAHPGTLART